MKRILLTLAAAALTGSSASAFYFPNWPGSLVPPRPAMIMSYTPGDPPSVQPPVPPETPTSNPGTPGGVPEPSTLMLAVIGVGVLVRKARRRSV